MAMKRYYAPGTCSLAAHISLGEAGLGHDLEKVDLGSQKTERGTDYASINPKGYVPALGLDGGEVLTEVSAVIQYIADQAPTSGSRRGRALADAALENPVECTLSRPADEAVVERLERPIGLGHAFTILNWTRFHDIDLAPRPDIKGLHGADCGTPQGAAGDAGGGPAEVGRSRSAPAWEAGSGAVTERRHYASGRRIEPRSAMPPGFRVTERDGCSGTRRRARKGRSAS
jgi:hypothetical protein